MSTARDDRDAEIRARAMAEIRAIVDAAKPARAARATYRSPAPGAVARRALLRSLADAHYRRVMGLADASADDAAA